MSKRYLITYELYLNRQIHRNRFAESRKTTRVIDMCPGKWWSEMHWLEDKGPSESHLQWDGCTVLNTQEMESSE